MLLSLLIAAALTVLAHIATIAIAGRAVGVRLLQVSYGAGPTLFQAPGFRLGALPISGSVRFSHSVQDQVPEADWRLALDRRSLLVQWGVMLSGCALVLGLAVALHGRMALEAFLALPAQLLAGAVSPLGEAQVLLARAADALRSSPFPVVLALVMAKFAAFNLLPLPPLNGGAAVAALGRRLGLASYWPPAANGALLCLWMAVMALWALALGAYLLKL